MFPFISTFRLGPLCLRCLSAFSSLLGSPIHLCLLMPDFPKKRRRNSSTANGDDSGKNSRKRRRISRENTSQSTRPRPLKPRSSAPRGNNGNNDETTTSEDSIVESVRCMFPVVETFRDYVQLLNLSLAEANFHISVSNIDPRISNNLLIASSESISIPKNAIEGLTYIGIQPEDTIERVIQNSIRNKSENVLAMGYSALSPFGKGSIFRNLDSRAPSTPVQILLSPAWKAVFNALGYVAMYYLLSSTTLLLPLSSANGQEVPRAKKSHAILQLSGPLAPKSRNNQMFNAAVQSKYIIRYSKTILHRTRIHENAVNASNNGLEMTSNNLPPSANTIPNKGLPSNHFLNQLDSSYSSAILLYANIFGSKPKADVVNGMKDINASRSRQRTNITKRLRPLLPHLQKFIMRTKSRCFRRILGRIDPLPTWMRLQKGNDGDLDCISNSKSPAKSVARYLALCLRQSLLFELVGSKRNLQIIIDGIYEMICRRTRNESFDIKSLILNSGFKIGEVPWLYLKDGSKSIVNPTDLSFRKEKALIFFSWIFRSFLTPILLNSFHVTDSQIFGKQLIYYRREVWNKLQFLGTKRALLCEENRLFSEISTVTLRQILLNRDKDMTCLGIHVDPGKFLSCSQLKFIPKINGIRPIQRLQVKLWKNEVIGIETVKKLNITRNYIRSFFSIALKVIFLSCKQHENKSNLILGSSVFGLDEIYARILKYKLEWIKHRRRPLYIVTMDMKKSFDNIPLDILINSILPEVIQQDRFVVFKYAIVSPRNQDGKMVRRFESYICEKPGDEVLFKELIRNQFSQKVPAHATAIFIDLVRTQVIHTQDLLTCINQFITQNIVSLPAKSSYVKQIRGVAQGNPLSPILTSLFYGYVERNQLKEYLNNGDVLFMRQIDDIFFASMDRSTTENFARKLTSGCGNHVYGMNINYSKTKSNFDRAGCLSKNSVIAWCGLLVDTRRLEIRNDFTRYTAPRLQSLREIISVDFLPSGGLSQKAWSCFRPKIHPVLFDCNLNSNRVIALNIYQACLLVALKICSYSLAIKVQNQEFLKVIAIKAVHRCCDLIRKTPFTTIGMKNNCRFPFSQPEVLYLVQMAFLWAFRERLTKKATCANLTTCTLQTNIDECEKELAGCGRNERLKGFKAVCEDDLNSVLKSLRL